MRDQFEFTINNKRRMVLTQIGADNNIIFELQVDRSDVMGGGKPWWFLEVGSKMTIPPEDFVMLMNYYRQQREKGLPIL